LFDFTENKNKGLEKALGFKIKNKTIIQKSLTHKSYNKTDNNERLEFLGDTILGSIVSEYFFYANKNSSEGDLSIKRDSVVNRKNLNEIAKEIFADTELRYKTKTISENMYGDFLEALIGAIYIEKGYEEAKIFVEQRIINKNQNQQKETEDFKGMLILKANQENKKINFVKLAHKGPDHKRRHKIGLLFGEKTLMTCWSNTVKEGERNLSKRAYKKLYENNSHS
tara:strand:- start:73 stop:747 length:675 start_codon:yes stop_codon:yes gene_type:complete